MQQQNEHIRKLWQLYTSDKANAGEVQELYNYINDSRNNDQNIELFEEALKQQPVQFQHDPEIEKAMLKAVFQSRKEAEAGAPAYRVPVLKTSWIRYAAIFLLIAGTAVYFYKSSFTSDMGRAGIQQARPQSDIAPGGNKAVLTLADGSTIVLDTAANGALAVQGNTNIIKLGSGSLAYQPKMPSERIQFNSISTPKGGHYQIVLPDGSKVWLNAASSLRYPAFFKAGERVVELEGEAYFEVTTNMSSPFIVKTYKEQIKVLGTSFNVNSYRDEPAVKISLLQGAVMVENQVVQPGKAYLNGKIIAMDAAQDIAWKNGVFSFHKTGIDVVMRQLARWYDVTIEYPAGIPAKDIGGSMGMDLNLRQVLNLLKALGVHTELRGRTLSVQP